MRNIFVMIITLTVGVILAGALLAPVIDDVTTTEQTFTNEGYSRYTSISSTDEDVITIEWDHTNPKILSIGDQEIDCSTLQAYTSICFGDDWAIRYITSAGGPSTTIQYIGPTASEYLQATNAGTADLTITLESGDMTITDGTSTKTADYTDVYYPDTAGSMIMKKATSSAYLLKDSSIINANGSTQVGNVGVGVRFEGTIEDGYTFTLYRNTNDCTVSNVVSHYTEDSKYIGLVELSSITFDMTPDGGSATEATYSYFLVPYQVTAELSQHLDDGEIAMMDMIPIMVIICLVMAMVGYLVFRSRD